MTKKIKGTNLRKTGMEYKIVYTNGFVIPLHIFRYLVAILFLTMPIHFFILAFCSLNFLLSVRISSVSFSHILSIFLCSMTSVITGHFYVLSMSIQHLLFLFYQMHFLNILFTLHSTYFWVSSPLSNYHFHVTKWVRYTLLLLSTDICFSK